MTFDAGQLGEWESTMLRGESMMPRRVAESPLRIVVLGWARLSRQASEGSGLNLNASELAAALSLRGHRVMYLRSGMDYSMRPGMRLTLQEVWRGVGCFSIVNSPNLAPGNFNFRNVKSQTSHEAQSQLVVDWVRAVRADVVHVQALEGFSLDTIAALREVGVPVVVTPHNYYYLCPQVDLLAHERVICEDHHGGERCVDCLSHAPDSESYLAWRRRYQTAERLLGPDALGQLKFRSSKLGRGVARFLETPTVPVMNGEPERWGRPEPLPARPDDINERFLAAEGKLHACNDYGRRRLAAVAALNAASRVLCPSRFLRRTHASFGVLESVLAHVPLGQPHFDRLRANAEASPYYDVPPWTPMSGRPLRLAYFGNAFPNKGLATLCAAVEAMPAELASKVHVVIRASGFDAPFRAWMAGRSNVSFLGGYDLNQLMAAPSEYDVCVFPNAGLENSPFVVLEALHAGRTVIASNLGGPTDFIEHGRNGLLYAAASVPALVEAIASVVDGRFAIPSPREVHAMSPLVSFASFVDAVERELRAAT
jgi:glycosyltransferase involved in cell wall biosynthesis